MLAALDRMDAISAAASDERDLDSLMAVALDAAIELNRADFGIVQLFDPKERCLTIAAQRGFDAAFLDHFAVVRAGDPSVSGRAFGRRERVVVEDVATDRDFVALREVARAAGFRAAASAPMFTSLGEPVGMLTVHFRAVTAVSGEDAALTEILARDLARGIERTRVQIALTRSEAGRRQAEANRSFLMAELQERTRGLLRLIRSVARRTAERSDGVEDFLDHFDGRLAAIGRTQGALTRNSEISASLESLILEEFVAAAGPDQVSLQGPEVQLNGKVAELLSLAVHELVTNAVKFGALSTPAGRVEVEWSVGGGAEGRVLSLTWRESGVRLVQMAPQRVGFGRSLLEHALPYEFGAKTELSFEPGGLKATLEVPLTMSDMPRQNSGDYLL